MHDKTWFDAITQFAFTFLAFGVGSAGFMGTICMVRDLWQGYYEQDEAKPVE